MEKQERIKILLIDDDEEDYIITKDIISEIKYQKYSIDWTSSYKEALVEIKKNIYDVFLIDCNLGIKSGLDLIDEITKINRNIPIIILTGLDNHEIDILAMKKGASDFLQKSKIDAESLERSIRYAIEKKNTESQILYLAYYDQITNLPNRIFFKEQLNYTLAHAKRYNKLLAVLFLDLDNFKLINDSLGHHIGDILLKEVAKRLFISIRKSDIIARNEINTLIDTIARIGGDEFTISLTEINNYENASIVANRIIKNLNEPFIIEGHEIFTSASIGISLYPEDSDDSDTLLKYADNAMYYAKKEGKNCFQYYQKSMNDNLLDKINMINNIRKAKKLNEFLIYYQPKMEFNTGKIIGFEALIRWNKNGKGITLPIDFIPFAEEHHLIGFITEWIIHETCRQLKEWNSKKLILLPISINLPITQFKKPDLVEYIKKIITSYDISAKYLEFEVTESIFMENMDLNIERLNELQLMGIQISIDDFGSGFSSLNRLKQIPCNTIKIDRSFIKFINKDPRDPIIISTIISLAHGLNMNALAEGVETEIQFKFLKKNNCNSMQGFLLSPPLPKEKISDILKKEEHGNGIGIELIKKIEKNNK